MEDAKRPVPKPDGVLRDEDYCRAAAELLNAGGGRCTVLGSSAPEILLALIGAIGDVGTTNVDELGPGTIVGSAVFNVLFVIGCCALASKEVLPLTWWPLFRDCSYYVVSLVVLSACFGFVVPCKGCT